MLTVVQVSQRLFHRDLQDELGRITIKTAGCYTAFGTPIQCVTEGVFDLKWESQLQVRRPGILTASCELRCTAHSICARIYTLSSCPPSTSS